MATAVATPKTAKKGLPPLISRKLMSASLAEAATEQLLMDVPVKEPCSVRVKPSFSTACWTWTPPHLVAIGDGLLRKENIKENLSEEQVKQYVKSHYHHEQGHALYTERDLARVNRALKVIKASFRIFNLFEDVRIEHRYRLENNYKFNWLDAEKAETSDVPATVLWGYIQCEGDVEAYKSLCLADKALAGSNSFTMWGPSKLARMLTRVESYYRRACATTSTLGLMPLIAEWIAEFGDEEDEANNPSELKLSQELQEDADKLMDFLEGTVDPSASDSPPTNDPVTSSEERKGKVTPKGSTSSVAKKGKVVGDKEVTVSLARVQAVAEKLKQLFNSARRKEQTWTPKKRISVKHLITDRAPFRQPVKSSIRKKKFTFVYECSGSMGMSNNYHMNEGKVFLGALAYLSRMGLIEGHLIVCADTMSGPMWERFEFPLAQSVVNRIQALNASEGIETALAANLDVIKGSDYVMVYTDGQISDKAVNKQALHKQGVTTWGLYAGPPSEDILEGLLTHFDKAILRGSAEELADAILAQI